MRSCTIEGCDRKHSSKGLCNLHMLRSIRTGSPLTPLKYYPDSCTVENCNGKHKEKGLCSKHFQRLKKHGSIKTEIHDLTSIQRFLKKTKINQTTGCIEWIGCKIPKGYGQFTANAISYRAHRFSYQYYIGPIPSEMFVLHKCDNRGCVNPDHLFLGTHDDNMKDMVNKNRSVHRYGELSPSATLTNREVIKIKEQIQSKSSYKEIMNNFNISKSILFDIRSGRSWSTISGEQNV
jgi:hypothetical protein